MAMADLPLLEGLLHLVLDVFLEPADEEPLDVFRAVVVRVGDGRRVEHVHEAGEAPGLAVVGGGREHDERVGAAGQELGQLGPQR